MKKRSLVLLFVLVVLFGITIAQPLKFHPIGDSTTEAYELETAWRYWFYKLLQKNGFSDIDFVGSRTGTFNGTNFSDNDWDKNHDGHSGSTASQVLNGGLSKGHSGSIKVWAPAYTPHIAVIFLGTNDIRQGRSAGDIIKSLQGIIQVLRDAREEVKIIVCQIPNWDYASFKGSQAGVDALNAQIPTLVSLATSVSPIKIVDLNTDYSLDDSRDGIHPGKVGAQKIADRIYDAVLPWLNGRSGPSIQITSPLDGDVFEIASEIAVDVDVRFDEGTSIDHVAFYSGDSLLGLVDDLPYRYVWEIMKTGLYTIKAVATDTDGNSSQTSVRISVVQPQGPYGNFPHAVPGIIEIEEYDLGGAESAYFDDSKGSETGVDFRAGEDVDLVVCEDFGGGYNLGYANAGEWLEYTVNVEQGGEYLLVLRAACVGDGKTVFLESNGVLVADAISIVNTGGWQKWKDVVVEGVELEKGEQVLRLTIGDKGGVNLNYMKFDLVDAGNVPSVRITSPVDGDRFVSNEIVTITAEAFSPVETIASVDFYVNNKLLGSDDSSPYSFDWSGMSAGTYIVKTVAINDSSFADSASISVILVASSPSGAQLTKGWNLIAWPVKGSTPVDIALSSIWENVMVVKDLNGFMDKSIPQFLYSLPEMSYGRGYFVYVSEDCELVW